MKVLIIIFLLALLSCGTSSKYQSSLERTPAASQTIQFIGADPIPESSGVQFIEFAAKDPTVRLVGSVQENSGDSKDTCKIVTNGDYSFKIMPNENFFLMQANHDEAYTYIRFKSFAREFEFNLMCSNSQLKPMTYNAAIAIITQTLFREI